LALILARAVLRSEASEKDILRRLRDIGFAAAEPIDLPRFPINSLTGLALGIFLYLVLAIPFFGQVMDLSHQQTGGLTTAAKVTLVRLLTVGVTVWLLQRYAFFRREPGEPLRFFAYVVNGVLAAVVSAGICLAFHLDDPDPLAASHGDIPLILLTFLLCTAVAACCNDWVKDQAPPLWWRFAEAAGCGLVMAAGMGIVVTYLSGTLPFPVAKLEAWQIALLVAMPSALAMVIGACVPHIYRSAWRAATVRRQQARAPDAAAVSADAGTHAAASGTVIALVRRVPKRNATNRPARRRVRAG
jgi:MFS family permease